MATTTKTEYIETVGRRKTATARVRLTHAKAYSVVINGKSLEEYFKSKSLEATVLEAFAVDPNTPTYSVSAKVMGGGLSSQADAIRLGIARALVKEEHTRRIPLKRAGYLKRDPRAKERKKFGLKKARKAPQWSKR